MIRSKNLWVIWTGVLAFALIVLMINTANAAHITLKNWYISVSLGTGGKVKVGADNDAVEYDCNGRWAVAMEEGDPETEADNRAPLIYLGDISPAGNFGYFKVKVGDNVRMIGDSATGVWTQTPRVYLEPRSGLGEGRTGSYIKGQWTITPDKVTVDIRLSLVRDQARFEFVIRNNDNVAKNVGFAMNGDAVINGASGGVNTGGYPWIPGIGYSRSAGMSMRPYPTVLSGTSVPEYFEIVDTIDNPTFCARNILKGYDCSPPDCIAIGEFSELSPVNVWLPAGYNPNSMIPLDNIAWSLSWNQKPLAGYGRATRKIVTYYGVGVASAAWTYTSNQTVQQDSVVLAVQSLKSLKYDSTSALRSVDLLPSTFEIKAYVYNLATDPGPYNLEDVNLTIYLPPGLELVNKSNAQQSVGKVPINSESMPVSWQVKATGEYCGELTYYVSARDTVSGWQQIIARKIMVPATKRGVFNSGWMLMHVPFNFNDNRILNVFGLREDWFSAIYYDAVSKRYLPVRQVKPGQAFWMYVDGISAGKTQSFIIAPDAAIVGEVSGKQQNEYYVSIRPGWNMIGNPFVYPVYWGQVLVHNPAKNTTVSLDQAAKNNWISKTLFSWNPNKQNYDVLKSSDALLLPWNGYWATARVPLVLVFRPAAFQQGDVTALSGGY